jgi:dTDP-4-amino-4,6-dideoxygalactose transaminase
MGRRRDDHEFLTARLAQIFSASHVTLTDSGTSALGLALQILAGEGRTVAFPGYACVDLAAAARYAGVKVRLYDIDPATLSPDLDSVSRVLQRGATAIVVAHLYGFPADVAAVNELAAAHGAVVIEDAAQGAGGTLSGARLGSFGTLTILSFQRGKGITGGSGGALLAIAPELAERVAESARRLTPPRAGWRDLAVATMQWMFGRPRLYSIPCAIPGLRLGEMVYHPARDPGSLSAAAATLLRAALPRADREIAARCRNAATLMEAVREGEGLGAIHPIGAGTSGYLRFPVRDLRRRAAVPWLGILRGYPCTLRDQEALRPCLHPNEAAPLGADELQRSLFTLPTHSLLTPRELELLGAWLRFPAPRTVLGLVLT